MSQDATVQTEKKPWQFESVDGRLVSEALSISDVRQKEMQADVKQLMTTESSNVASDLASLSAKAQNPAEVAYYAFMYGSIQSDFQHFLKDMAKNVGGDK